MSDIHTQREKSQTAIDEEAVLQFWNSEHIFEQSISAREGCPAFVFFDGPPFATGLPHYGHVLPGTIKDVVPRYQTMRGNQVVRRWGWDCHGLPIEHIIEKKLDLNSRKEILDYGIEQFNTDARNQVLEYKSAWEEIIPRTGRWVDMENHYTTMDVSYTQSCWWAFGELHKNNLVYKGYKPMHLCPRCETTLSNNEVAEGYTDITDISVTVPFELSDERGTYLLAWTTTPWTLPGNTALTVGADIVYVKLQVQTESGPVQYIVARNRAEQTMQQAGITDWDEIAVLGSDALVGRSYIPPYNYFVDDTNIEHHSRGWKIYEADFITDDTGTGIAHQAPAYGADDYYLAQQLQIPLVHHVSTDGRFVDAVTDFAGLLVKSRDDHQSTDIEIIKNLAHRGLLFSKEKIVHSYPHCWRCDTPLLNYVTTSWFIKTTALRDRMLAENTASRWVPDHLGHKRFANWIENNVDWAVSRSRFWGAPLPIWENQTTGEYDVVGSVGELQDKTRSKNNFIFIRHGESVGNVEGVICHAIDTPHDRLTEAGKEQVIQSYSAVQDLIDNNLHNPSQGVDVVIHSPSNRTRQTALMLGEHFGTADIVSDDRIGEISFGTPYNDGLYADYMTASRRDDYTPSDDAESHTDVVVRTMDFLYDIDAQYDGKTIVIVTHATVLSLALSGVVGMSTADIATAREGQSTVANAQPCVVDFAPIPHNRQYELDLHRPYSDNIVYTNDQGQEYKIIGDVFDCWYESGSMPFASVGYMGADQSQGISDTPQAYPADFICEAIDQTRGWFYSLLALGVGVFDTAPMRNVIVTGHVMAEDGKKMSKKLQNYPELGKVFDAYGADALRYFLLHSPVMRGEKVNLIEKEIDEINKKIIMRLKNTLVLFETYNQGLDTGVDPYSSPNHLDRWILSRLGQLHTQTTQGLDAYELDRACLPLLGFVDDFSTWYIRRNRSRLKSADSTDSRYAQVTTWYVLRECARIMAPCMPFVADYIWMRLRMPSDEVSVHLTNWADTMDVDETIISDMQVVRDIVSLGLDARVQAKTKVRQPLGSMSVVGEHAESVIDGMADIIQDELNIKQLVYTCTPGAALQVTLDTTITPELQTEGDFREFVRAIQSLRKQMDLSPHDLISLQLVMDADGRAMVEIYFDELEQTAAVSRIDWVESLDTDVQQANNIQYQVLIELL